MDFARFFEVPAPSTMLAIHPSLTGDLAMRLATDPGLAETLVTTALEVNPGIRDVVEGLARGGLDKTSLLTGIALALELAGRQTEKDAADESTRNAEFVDTAIPRYQAEYSHFAASSDTVLLVRESALAAMNASTAAVIRTAISFDRAADDLIALAQKATARTTLYSEYQTWLRTYGGDRLRAAEQVRNTLASRLFQLAYLREHCAADASNIADVKRQQDYQGGSGLVLYLMQTRPTLK